MIKVLLICKKSLNEFMKESQVVTKRVMVIQGFCIDIYELRNTLKLRMNKICDKRQLGIGVLVFLMCFMNACVSFPNKSSYQKLSRKKYQVNEVNAVDCQV